MGLGAMDKVISRTVLVLLSIAPVASMSDGLEVDANGNGVLTLDEVQASFPDVTLNDYMAMDLNADGSLDAREVRAAEEAGMMPETDQES